MEYGDEQVRILTEIDEIEKPRQRVRFQQDCEERTVLIDQVGHRPRWDLTVEHPVYGKLVCSYYPLEARKQLEGYFGSGFIQERNGKRVIPCIPHWSCAEAGMDYLLGNIQQGLHDAMSGLVMEAEIHGLLARNGHEFTIPRLSQERQIKQIRDYYQARMNRRLGTRQGQRKELIDFLGRAYRAYCSAADEMHIATTDPFTGDSNARVTQEKLVEHMKRKRNREQESGMTVRALTKQLKTHGLTYAELIERCRHTRWKETAELEPKNKTL